MALCEREDTIISAYDDSYSKVDAWRVLGREAVIPAHQTGLVASGDQGKEQTSLSHLNRLRLIRVTPRISTASTAKPAPVRRERGCLLGSWRAYGVDSQMKPAQRGHSFGISGVIGLVLTLINKWTVPRGLAV